MSKKIIIIPLSLYMNNLQKKTEAAFRQLGIGWFELMWNFIPLPSFLEVFRSPSLPTIFDHYRRDDLDTHAFRQIIRLKFPHVQITDAQFDKAWNAMQEVTRITLEAFKEARTLQKMGFEVYLLAGSNRLHIQDIKKKSNLDSLPGTPFYSYDQKKLGKDLFTSLLKHIRTQHEDITAKDIAFFYTPPQDPYPRAGKFAWCYDPVKKFEYFQASQYVANLKREAASTNGFTLIPCQPKIDKKAGILKAIHDLGWIKEDKVNQIDKPAPTITHQHRIKTTATKSKKTNPDAGRVYNFRPSS